ncbi:MAG: anaerobic ribonucleoside-triphosphate reductase activating protein [Erysipelotrichia bacterium]|nr:anaerobic ribonucleoside-triphosphate reductase activating protein [Erysipelotrichia bacterium]NCC54615.1 anaerobic ribonucleoside-triphosphate reductase activating protein [Erysipelotrichia bacterium]
MKNTHSLLQSTSFLYRCTSKFYDKQLNKYKLGSGQLIFILSIYENEGISMNELAKKGVFDKGTVTKSIAKLEEEGYIQSVINSNDKRVRNLYTTQKTKDIIGDIYLIRSEWFQKLSVNFSEEEIQQFIYLHNKMMENAIDSIEEVKPKIKIFGLQKTTLLDYPEKLACTIFTGGCNLRCPFCQNSDLVFLKEDSIEIEEEEVLTYLQKRKNILEGVCISGGEPLVQDIEPFLRKIKAMGYAIKLDTNGCFFNRMKELIEKGLIDYVAMDIKNSKEKYAKSAGLQKLDLTSIEESIQYLMKGSIPYEFRTTIVKELHDKEDIVNIGKWIQGAKKYCLQNFEDSERVIQSHLHAHDKEELFAYKQALLNYVEDVVMKGI